jgi:hypothetical protein
MNLLLLSLVLVGVLTSCQGEANKNAQPDTSIKLQGAEALNGKKEGQVAISVDKSEGAVTCAIDGETIECAEGNLTLDLDNLKPGSHQLTITAADGRVNTINFCAKQCDGSSGEEPNEPTSPTSPVEPIAPLSPFATDLQLGYSLALTVPQFMHVTEYSTSKTFASLNVYRIMNYSDPTYLGNTRCDNDYDRVVSALSQSGAPLDYCHSTPTVEEYKEEFQHRLANNHVEVSTSDKTAGVQERLSVSVYDRDYEFMSGRSRFLNLCGHAEIKRQALPMLGNFFAGRNPESVNFYYCDAILPNAVGRPVLWKVGGFIDIEDFDWQCLDCSYARAVEVIYMATPDALTWRDDYFARQAQDRILGYLRKIQP